MINEDRVKELFHLDLFDEEEQEELRKAGKYFRNDFVVKEMLISFFAGTLIYLLVLALCILNVANSLLDQLNTMNYTQIAIYLGVSYVAFLALYLLVTYLVYTVRYTRDRRILKKYTGHLKKLESMYVREDKLKS